MKKILLIGYHFPPSLEVGGKRMAAMAKHLPRFGWENFVLTIEDDFIEKKDESATIRSEDRIFKAPVYPTIRDVYLGTKRILNVIKGKILVGSVQVKSDPVKPLKTNAVTNKGSDGILSRVRDKIKKMSLVLLTTPDLQRGWILPATLKAIAIVRSKKVDWVLTSSPPLSTQLIGLFTKRVTGVRWVMDLRDPILTTTEDDKRFHFGNVYVTILRHVENLLFRNADAILTTTNRLKEALIEKHGAIYEGRIHCIPNGFDFEQSLELLRLPKHDVFTISYIGTLYLKRSPEAVFQAISDLLSEGKIKNGDIAFKLVGECSHVNSVPMDVIVKKYGLDSTVQVSPPVSSRNALEILARSHIALLIALEQPFQIPAKIFEYMAAGLPVLALTEEGATKDLVEETGIGRAFRVDDIDGIKKYILDIFHGSNSFTTGNNYTIASYDRRQLVSVMAGILDGRDVPR